MTKGKYSKVFAVIGQINSNGVAYTHTELVKQFTNNKKESLSDLLGYELQEFERYLISLSNGSKKIEAPTNNKWLTDPLNDTRRAIISQFKSIGRTTTDAIRWAENYGVNGVKLKFNDYNGSQLYILLNNAKKIKQQHINKINKTL